MKSTRKSNKMYLIGKKDLENLSRLNQLPTIVQVLRRFHYHLSELKLKRKASVATIDEIFSIWKRALIPVNTKCNSKVDPRLQQSYNK